MAGSRVQDRLWRLRYNNYVPADFYLTESEAVRAAQQIVLSGVATQVGVYCKVKFVKVAPPVIVAETV